MYDVPFFVKLSDQNTAFSDPETKLSVAGIQVVEVKAMSPLIRQWLMNGGLKEVNEDGTVVTYNKVTEKVVKLGGPEPAPVITGANENTKVGLDQTALAGKPDGSDTAAAKGKVEAAQAELDEAKAKEAAAADASKSQTEKKPEEKPDLDLDKLLNGDGDSDGADGAGKGKTTGKSGK